MPSPRLVALLALLPLGVACRTALASPGASPPAHVASADFLPPAKDALELNLVSGKSVDLEMLLDRLSESTGVGFLADEATRTQLRQSSLGMHADATIPAAEAWRWSEGVLVASGFQLEPISMRPPYLLGVSTLIPVGGRTPVRHRTVLVASDELELCSEHPAFAYMTVVDMPHVDARQLGNSLRALTNDPTGRNNVIPVGNTSSVVLTGQGPDVADLATMLRIVEDQARKQFEEQPGGSAPGDGDSPPQGATSPPG